MISNDEIWVILRKVQDGFEQAFPPESNGDNPFATIWMEKVVSASEVLYSNIFCLSLREECSDSKTSAKRRRLTQLYHSKTVTAINNNMQISNAAYSDSNIFAIFALAHHHQFLAEPESDPFDEEQHPTQGPLNSLRLLNLYGSKIEHASVHAEAFTRIVALRGGIEAIDFPGLSQAASYGELIISCRTLKAPMMKFIPSLLLDLDASLSSCKRRDHPLRNMGRGFDVLTRICTSTAAWELQLALRRLALYSLAVDDYMAGRSISQTLSVISEQRNFVQHGIMSLLALVPEEDDAITRICLLAGICYSFLCVFPFPAAPFTALLQQMKSDFFTNDFSIEWKQAPKLMVWIFYISGVAAVGNSEHRGWIVTALDRCFRRLKLDSWEDVKTILQDFLWLPITNDNDGMALWEQVETSSPVLFSSKDEPLTDDHASGN